MRDPVGRYDALVERLVDAVVTTRGATPADLRRAVFLHAARRGTPAADPVPASLAPYVAKVARHAYQVTDEDVAALRRDGASDDAVFEITVAAAVGAALHRLDRGLAALRGVEPD